MTYSAFWLVIAATVADTAGGCMDEHVVAGPDPGDSVDQFVGNLFFVAVQDAGAIVPLSSRPNWRGRVDAAMLILPALAGVGAALLFR